MLNFICIYEYKIQHKIIFAFLLLKGTFVTWHMGRERLLATSNESTIFEKKIKRSVWGKKGIVVNKLLVYDKVKKLPMR
jgi:hypothetical protein